MPIPYTLRENNLVESPDVFSAQVLVTKSSGTTEIVDRMLSQGSTVTRADCLAVIENTIDAIEAMLLDGQRVNFGGLVDLFPSIRGKFASITDSFDPERHRVEVSSMCGSRVRKNFQTYASVEKVITPKPMPTLLAYRDLGSGASNSEITPANIGSIEGKNLSYDESKADEGIFYVPLSAGAPVKVPNTSVQKNKPGELVFLNPEAIPPGQSYWLEVRNRVNGIVQIRTGRLDAELMVP